MPSLTGTAVSKISTQGMQLTALLGAGGPCLYLLLSQVVGLNPRICVYAAAYVFVSILFIYMYSFGEAVDVLSPGIGVVLLLFLYSISSAIYGESFSQTNYGYGLTDHVMALYYVSCLLGLIGFAIGILLVKKMVSWIPWDRTVPLLSLDDAVARRKFVAYGVIIGLCLFPFVAPSFNLASIPSYAERALELRVERMSSSASGLRAVFLVEMPITIILSGATLLAFRARSGLARSAGALLFLVFVTRNMLAGWRGIVVSALLIPVCFFHYRIRPIRLPLAIVLGGVLYLFVNTLPILRNTSNPIDMLQLLLHEVGTNGFRFAAIANSGELLVGTNLMRLIGGIEYSDTFYTHGSSILTELAVFVPRALMEARPLPLAERFVDEFYHGIREAGGGYGFFILQEGYWAFGLLGVFLSMLFYGGTLQAFYEWFVRNKHRDFSVVLYASMYAVLVLSSVRTGIIGSYKGALMSLIPFLIVWALPSVRFSFPARNGMSVPGGARAP